MENKWFNLAQIFGTLGGLSFIAFGISHSFDTLLFTSGLIVLTIAYAFIGFLEETSKEKPRKALIETIIFLMSIVALGLFLIIYPR
jgi:vacuolar-type H+-ATPase subunit I/STV1